MPSRPVSQNTFGPQEIPHLRAPSPKRVVSSRPRTPEPDTRPTLVRSQTPHPPQEDQQAIARMFSENMFSDPAPQKLLKMGPKLFTDGHQRLVYLLREECGRLFSFNKSLKDRIASLERQNRSQNEAIADLRSIVHAKSEKIVSMAADLRDSQEALQEMDAMLSETRNKRLSRLGQRNMETLDLGEHAI